MTRDEAIEHVAQGLSSALKKYAEVSADYNEFDGDRRSIAAHLFEAKQDVSRAAYRASLEAIREPTEATQVAGHRVRSRHLDGEPSPGTDEIYTAMIDQLIKELDHDDS